MSSKRNGLFLLLVLTALLAAVAWTPATASEKGTPTAYTDPPATWGGPEFDPASGEPDVGGTPAPRVKTSGYVSSAPTRVDAPMPWARFQPWVRLVLRTWSVWFPGLS